jgi:hypothetical protein
MKLKQEMTIVTTDTHSIDLESLKQLAANPNVNAEIHGNGDVYISTTTKG